MNCQFHPDRPAVRRCEKCGEALCQECAVVVDGRAICKHCVSYAFDDRREVSAHPRKPRVNFLMFTFWSLSLPGANYMFMGMMKRGLFVMSSFFLSVYMLCITGSFGFGAGTIAFAFLTAIIYIASFFDGYHLRRCIITGKGVRDSVSDLTGFIHRFRLPIVGFLVFICVSGILSRVLGVVNRMIGYPIRTSDFSMLLFSVAIIIFGLYIVSRRSSSSEDMIDKRTDSNY